MKVIMLMYDSLNRRMLPPYGCDWVHAPNFKRLAEKTVTFDYCYAGSLPCIPARRELHSGRYNFLHRCWGPLEPFDDSMPEILKQNGVYTHLISDHFHYWEDGGSTYHSRYNTWEIVRGQAGDPWIGQVKDPDIPAYIGSRNSRNMPAWRQDWVNRQYMQREEDLPQSKTFNKGIEFIRRNYQEDNWFLHVETFDPHEPFYSHQKYKDVYQHEYSGPHFEWPDYAPVTETPEQIAHCRDNYAAVVSMCDEYLGKVLDVMDEKDLWKDTMLIVNADHGFLLGEHNWWGKKTSPFYNEVATMPFFIWDPRSAKKGERRNALVQTIDIPPTILEAFGIDIPQDMQGKPLRHVVADDEAVREAILFGQHGMHVNCTDGRYVYMRAPKTQENTPLFNYTLMPLQMKTRFSIQELRDFEVVGPFSFTKGCRVLKTPALEVLPQKAFLKPAPYTTLLFDLATDPQQEQPIQDQDIEEMMIQHLVRLMKENDAPDEQYERLGLEPGES